MKLDVVIVGAGPAGLSVALHAKQRGLNAVVLERGRVTNSILSYPVAMSFFTTQYSMEIGAIPFDCRRAHATREEALSYYARIPELAGLDVRTRTSVESIEGENEAF